LWVRLRVDTGVAAELERRFAAWDAASPFAKLGVAAFRGAVSTVIGVGLEVDAGAVTDVGELRGALADADPTRAQVVGRAGAVAAAAVLDVLLEHAALAVTIGLTCSAVERALAHDADVGHRALLVAPATVEHVELGRHTCAPAIDGPLIARHGGSGGGRGRRCL
jgi:hypothetical protein